MTANDSCFSTHTSRTSLHTSTQPPPKNQATEICCSKMKQVPEVLRHCLGSTYPGLSQTSYGSWLASKIPGLEAWLTNYP